MVLIFIYKGKGKIQEQAKGCHLRLETYLLFYLAFAFTAIFITEHNSIHT